MSQHQFKRLPAPPQQLVDAVVAFLSPKLMGGQVAHGPVPWLRLILVAIARAASIGGASAVAITTADPDRLMAAIAKVAAIYMPDVEQVRQAVRSACEVVERTYDPAVPEPPQVDLTPVKTYGYGTETPDRPTKSPEPHRPVPPAIPVDQLEQILRSFSASCGAISSANVELPAEVTDALRRSAERNAPTFDSHGTTTCLEEQDAFENGTAVSLRRLPRMRFPRAHRLFRTFRTALDKLVHFAECVTNTSVDRVVEKYTARAAATGRTFSISEAARVAELMGTYNHVTDQWRVEAVCSLAEILALTMEEAECVRLSRWFRQPLEQPTLRAFPELPVAIRERKSDSASAQRGQKRTCDRCGRKLADGVTFAMHNRECTGAGSQTASPKPPPKPTTPARSF